ncbi:MAG: hypothetical protein AAFX76_09600 [Planctomycetota bacterium]
MPAEHRRRMSGLAECPDCRQELAAPLAAAGRPARCSRCGCRFMLPSADALFNNAAVYLMVHKVEDADERTVRQIKSSA